MDTRTAYNSWSGQYDTNNNRTRDLEAIALQQTLDGIPFRRCLEIGCGTGKNTEWLVRKASEITAVDLSENMIAKAREKITVGRVAFHQADITREWNFVMGNYDLISFSLVLEHIEDLDAIFRKCAACLSPGGYIYMGELHPFKQYTGSKARFDTDEGIQVLTCYNHHISDFTRAATDHGLQIRMINEFFDDDERSLPRILTLVFSH